MEKKYLILHKDYILSFDEEKCYVNGKEIEPKGGPGSKIKEELIDEACNQFYGSFFKRHFKNIVVLAAAGTSLDNGKQPGKSRFQLWEHCIAEIEALGKKIPKLKEKDFYKSKDIESLLSHIILFEKLNGVILDSDGNSMREHIEFKIKQACELSLDDSAPHLDFLNKLTARKPNDPRLQLFTTNYDTLFEQAAMAGGFVLIDGFSFTQPRTFSGRHFDYDIVHREKTRVKNEESFISRVLHLYKLHGSLTWEKNAETSSIVEVRESKNPLIIYPATDKYESSYEQPYFEMMSRFQQALRKEDVLLIVVGFGFQDKHIQNVIFEAVQQNPSFQLVIVSYNEDKAIDVKAISQFIEKTEKYLKPKRNVTVLFDKFSTFTDRLPENRTYSQTQPNDYAAIQS